MNTAKNTLETKQKHYFDDTDIEKILHDTGLTCDEEKLKSLLNEYIPGFQDYDTSIVKTRNTMDQKQQERQGFFEAQINELHNAKKQLEDEETLFKDMKREETLKKLLGTIGVIEGVLTRVQENIETEKEKAQQKLTTLMSRESKLSEARMIDVFVGRFLPRIYKEVFERKWEPSKPPKGDKPYGPAIRFSKSVLDVLNIDKTENAIALDVENYSN